MLEVEIPGFGVRRLRHLVLDYNGTLARDGQPIDGVPARLAALASQMELHVVTADTFGTARDALRDLPVRVVVLPLERQDVAKAEYVRELGTDATVAIGNGRNDVQMLQDAALSIAVIQEEGAASVALGAADVVCPTIEAALDLLRYPRRLVATLRS